MRYLAFSLIVSFVIVATGIFVGVSILFMVVLMLWLNMMIYSYKNIEKRATLFAFGFAFFVFLMGREFLEQYGIAEREWIFTDATNNHLYFCEVLALAGAWGAFAFYSNKNAKQASQKIIHSRFNTAVQKTAKRVFFLVLPFAMIYRVVIAIFVATVGYADYYTDFSESVPDNPILSLLNKIGMMLPVAFCTYLATLPSKKDFRFIFVFYGAYLTLTLFGGQRGPFLLGVLLVFIFLVYMQGIRPEEKWFKKSYLNWALILLPFVSSAGSIYNAIRFGEKVEQTGLFDGCSKFFYEQGVTSYVVKRAFDHEDQLPKDIYILQFTHSGALARICGNEVYNGNTVEHATKGGSFAHALGYVILGNDYLLGRGTGSSYIAELYYDFGYLGVFIGSLFYGWIFSLIYSTSSLFKRATIFIIITQLLWACRSSYVGFMVLLTAPATIILGFVLFLFNYRKFTFGGKSVLNKAARREYDIASDYNCFDIENEFVVGYVC